MEKLREGNQGEKSYLSIKGNGLPDGEFLKINNVQARMPASFKRKTNIKIANTY
jgi:hypothetical protein